MNTEREDRIMEAAGRLAKEAAPGRDLWPGIEQAIATRPRRRWQPVFAQAAGVLLLVGASSAITWFIAQEEPRVVEVSRPGAEAEFVSYTAPQALGSEYVTARARVVSQLDAELERLSPETRADVEHNLAVIRDAIVEISAALDRDPDNQLLQQLLVETYREEAAMIRKVGNLTQQLLPRQDI